MKGDTKLTEEFEDWERYEYNINQRDKAKKPKPYIPIKCKHSGCGFYFIPLANARQKYCSLHEKQSTSCPFENHLLQYGGFFANGDDKNLPTDFNHANYTPLR